MSSRLQMESDHGLKNKKQKIIPSPQGILNCIYKTKKPLIFKNILSWDVISWSMEDWIKVIGDERLDLRIGNKLCTQLPQWERDCKTLSTSLQEFQVYKEEKDSWMYFDYKHMNQYFKNRPDLLESLSWADFGFPEKDGKDSTIWIGSEGAYTPCHMDSYGCNIVAQVHGRKLWVMFPPSETSKLKPTRVPYEESSVYSCINFKCGLNVPNDLGEAHVVELLPGDVLIVPKHWWHYVENLTTAISINTWIPLVSDDASRLEEALVRFFVAAALKSLGMEEDTSLLNPNEIDLLDEPVDVRQISWCLEQVLKQDEANGKKDSCLENCEEWALPVPKKSAAQLQELLLKKCGCVNRNCSFPTSTQKSLSIDQVVNAFCHPEVIAKVAEILTSMKKN